MSIIRTHIVIARERRQNRAFNEVVRALPVTVSCDVRTLTNR